MIVSIAAVFWLYEHDTRPRRMRCLQAGFTASHSGMPHCPLSQQTFSRFALDYLSFGNAYLENQTSRLGNVLKLESSLAKFTRRGLDLDTYWYAQYAIRMEPYEFA